MAASSLHKTRPAPVARLPVSCYMPLQPPLPRTAGAAGLLRGSKQLKPGVSRDVEVRQTAQAVTGCVTWDSTAPPLHLLCARVPFLICISSGKLLYAHKGWPGAWTGRTSITSTASSDCASCALPSGVGGRLANSSTRSASSREDSDADSAVAATLACARNSHNVSQLAACRVQNTSSCAS